MAVIHSDAPPVHDPRRRNLGFGLGSVLLLAGTLYMVWFDYSREWKGYQREFQAIELDTAQARLEQEEARLAADQELAALQGRLESARAERERRQGEIEAARATLAEAERVFHVAEDRWKVDKSYYDAAKYLFEEERRHIMESEHETSAGQAAIDRAAEAFGRSEQRYQQAVLGLEQTTTERDRARARLGELTAAADDLEKQITRMTEDETTLGRQVDSLMPSVVTAIRNAPVIDMASPTLKIDQVILPHLLADINFTRIPRVDRCVTCHKGIAEPDYADLEQPFRAHPKLDLYLSDESPHPYNKFGCTVCHQGLDRATSFASAIHTPRDEEQEHEWASRYGWQEAHFWDFPQLPAEHSQAACRTCHLQEVRLRGADRYNRGLDIIERAGCYGCHKIAGYETQRKAGPDLRRVASKVTPAWAYRWIEDPRSYRPTTWMPRFFHLTNSSSPEDRARSAVEIAAIVEFLFDKSAPYAPATARAPAGDGARGRQVVSDRGCLGCHRIGEQPAARGTFGRDFGPALDRVGDKVTAEWLFDWVRDPKRYFPETNMPDLRLTDQEAADVTAYLMSLKGAPADPPPRLDEPLLDALAQESLRARLTAAQARERSAAMGTKEKKLYVGENLVARYGCFGCHNIAGFEQTLPIGVELSNEGTKLITRLDFGFVEIPHTKPAWFHQKMRDPRIFDTGKVKMPQEKLKMPDFGFTDEEAGAMVTLILSMQKDVLPADSHRVLDERLAAVEAGRRIVQDRNCRGCHVLEDEGGAIREVISDQAYYPPNLIGEGQKVQSDWLFSFLRDPASIRPWLKVRMPTFGLEESQATTVTKYFASLDKAPFPFHVGGAAPPGPDLLREGRRTFEAFKCISCHTVGAPPPGVSVADLAPNLEISRERLRHDWIIRWLRDPQRLLPGTRMPGFFYSDEQPLYPDADQKMEAVKEYLLTLGGGGARASAAPSTTSRSWYAMRKGYPASTSSSKP